MRLVLDLRTVTRVRRCKREDIVSEPTNDGRMEQSAKCGKEWEHDKISTKKKKDNRDGENV